MLGKGYSMKYRNSEGYADPCAGKALANLARDERRERHGLDSLRDRKNYLRLCKFFRQTAEEYGFEFPGQIWLRCKKSGRTQKDG